MAIRDHDHEAVKREHAALMKNPAKVAQLIDAAMSSGFFVALEQARIDGSVGPALFRHEYRRYFDMTLEAIREAQKETDRIRNALARLQQAAAGGANRPTITRLSAHPDDAEFQEGLRAFQGWLASLFETYLTLFSYVEGVNGATRKVDELATASKALLERRKAARGMGVKGADLFKALTEM
jgi:hypothetical protein